MIDPKLTSRLKSGQTGTAAFIKDIRKPETIAKAVCAFLNSEKGGVVYVGITSDGDPAGLKSFDDDKVKTLSEKIRAMIDPLALYSITSASLKDGDVVVIDVPSGADKPYLVSGAFWVRENLAVRAATRDEVNAMFDDRTEASERWERRISSSMQDEDLDTELVRSVRSKSEKRGRLVLDDDIDTDMEVLRELSYWRPKGFTNACDISFGKHPERRHPQTRAQLLVFRDDKIEDTTRSDWFDGSVLKLVERLMDKLSAYNETNSTFREDTLERDDQPRYHPYALREALVNAFAHRDYEAYSGGVKVSIYDDRIEFWNTGRLNEHIKISDLPRKHMSYPNNPDIAHAFFLNLLMERTGRGAERIVEACKVIGAPRPVWVQDHGGVTLTLYASLSPGEAAATQLNDRQRAFVEAVKPGEAVSLAEYMERFASDISDRQARRELSELEDFRLVRKEGKSVATVYRRLES